MKNRFKSNLSILRQKAEELLNKTEDGKRKKGKGGSFTDQPLHYSEAELLKLVYELEVHKLELGKQNEQLKSTRNEAEIASDITKLKQSEISLRESEENLRKFQKAIENAKVSVLITDKNGTIEFANPFFTQLTGYTREEYIGKNLRVLKSGFHSEAYYRQFWDTIESGKTWEGEFCNKKKSGEIYWEKAIVSPIYNEKNEITHYTGIKTDI